MKFDWHGPDRSLFAYEAEQILPDIVTLGKGLGAGFPISATLAQRKVCCFEFGDQGGTFNGNPLAAAIANAVVDVMTARRISGKRERIGAAARAKALGPR